MEVQQQQAPAPPKIRVVVRKRPLTQKETKRGDQDVLVIRSNSNLVVQEMKQKVDLTKYIEEHDFNFDNCFDSDADNQQIYEECVQPLVRCTFEGANTTCFAYGQTGSGKTHTMMGVSDGSVPGLYLLAAFDIINLLNSYPDYFLQVSFYEIYCGKLYDLLNKRVLLHCREDGKQKVNIVGLTQTTVISVEEIMQIMVSGLQERTSGTTGANADSSRSHAVLQLQLRSRQDVNKCLGKMSFIDLAGSERGADTIDQNRQTRLDGAEINKSLLALKECIRALDLEKKHLPFRGSKLTQVLKDSFTGNSKTTMIANVSPAAGCCEHTLNTLRYGDRVKELKKDGSSGGNAGSQKQTQQERELMLARQNRNVTKISLNQQTLQPSGQPQPLQNNFFGQQTLQKTPSGRTPTAAQQNQQKKRLTQQRSPCNSNNAQQQQMHSFNSFATQQQSHQPPQQPQQHQTNAHQFSTAAQHTDFNPQSFAFNANQNQQAQVNMNRKPMQVLSQNRPNGGSSQSMMQEKQNQQRNMMQASTTADQQAPWTRPEMPKPLREMPLQTYQGIEAEYADDIDRICGDHENLIKVILEEEETLISQHRKHIDDVVDIVKQDMGILQNVEEPQSNIEDYVEKLDGILMRKMEHILGLRSKLANFYKHLKKEENLQQLYTTKLNETGQSHQILQQQQLSLQQDLDNDASYVNPNDYYSHYSQQLQQNYQEQTYHQLVQQQTPQQYDQSSNYVPGSPAQFQVTQQPQPQVMSQGGQQFQGGPTDENMQEDNHRMEMAPEELFQKQQHFATAVAQGTPGSQR